MARAKKTSGKGSKKKTRRKTVSTKAGSVKKTQPKAAGQVKEAVKGVKAAEKKRRSQQGKAEHAEKITPSELVEEKPSPGERKVVDEDWKRQDQQKKAAEAEQKPKEEAPHPNIPPPNFSLFVSGLATQTLIALGQIENPFTKQKQTNRDQAKYTIDTLKMIEEKTTGNLTPEETTFLESVLYDLRMSYVSSAK